MAHLGPDVRLWIASQGPETDRLKQLTRGDARVEWLGLISEAEKISRIRGADVLCAPSLHGESFGVILLEGMAAGTPVVASDLPGYRTVASPDHDAILVEPGEAEVLAHAIDRALAGGPAVEAMVEAGLERAAAFSMARLAERYIHLYEKVRAGPH
jgi:phosphatidylinositol alpha-mannosyltransferase